MSRFLGDRTAMFLAMTLAFIAMVTAACASSLELTPLERQAQAIDRGLICPVCPGETIDQSQVELAKQMRATVRDKLAEGWTPEQVKRFFVERYGPGVLSAPPQRGFSVVAWTVPPVAVVAGLAALWLAMRGMRRRSPDAGVPERVGDPSLEPYLNQVDSALQARRPQSPPDATEG